jgi:hypothetical protein
MRWKGELPASTAGVMGQRSKVVRINIRNQIHYGDQKNKIFRLSSNVDKQCEVLKNLLSQPQMRQQMQWSQWSYTNRINFRMIEAAVKVGNISINSIVNDQKYRKLTSQGVRVIELYLIVEYHIRATLVDTASP